MKNIVIVGGGHAAPAAISKFLDLQFDGKITLITNESIPPYHRPPLSKKYLMGEMETDDLLIKSRSYYETNGIELKLSTEVVKINRGEKTLALSDGSELPYDKLLLTTGSIPRTLPDSMVEEGVTTFTLRNLADVDRIKPYFEPGKRVLIIGGGYIGLEAAAVANTLELDATLIEAAPRILQRVAAEETSAFLREFHKGKGVTIFEDRRLKELVKQGDHAAAIFEDGDPVSFDFALVGIGVNPATMLAEEAGINIENGIRVDDRACTSDPDIFAAGDCASFSYGGELTRLESVQNANDQAVVAASNMAGTEAIYTPVPWFWSDQYDLKLQIAGLNRGADKVVMRPGKREGSRSHWYFAGETFIAVDAFNDAAAFMTGKRLLEAGKSPSLSDVENPDFQLKALLR